MLQTLTPAARLPTLTDEVATDPRPAAEPRDWTPLFRADWQDVVFIHFAIDPALLQPAVPFALDLFEGMAFVSLVAFTQRRLRPCIGGALAAAWSAPLANHPFLNVRTYVRVGEEPGIYFLSEWIPNRLAQLIGPILYGLPYRLGRLSYRHNRACRTVAGDVAARGAALRFEATVPTDAPLAPATRPLDRFLLERYVAFTSRHGVARRFRIAHVPWPQAQADVRVPEQRLVASIGWWWPAARYVGANYSPGVQDVQIGPPERCNRPRGAAGTGRDSPLLAFVPLLALPALAMLARPMMPAWAFMWVLSFSLFFGCKWLTWCRSPVRRSAGAARTLAYLFAWVGMDADAFLDSSTRPPQPGAHQWIEGVTRAAVGAILVWCITRLMPTDAPVLRGWVAMFGLVLLLHFGTFHLLALLWQRAGVDARPLMNHPVRSRSLAEFWGKRWNRGFHQLALDLCFRPLLRTIGATGAMLATFALSGVIHDLVISLPAGAGFGRPTLYFLLQGAGVCFERAAPVRALRRRQPMLGRAWTIVVLLAPMPLLFHRAFVLNVIVPFLHVIGAT